MDLPWIWIINFDMLIFLCQDMSIRPWNDSFYPLHSNHITPNMITSIPNMGKESSVPHLPTYPYFFPQRNPPPLSKKSYVPSSTMIEPSTSPNISPLEYLAQCRRRQLTTPHLTSIAFYSISPAIPMPLYDITPVIWSCMFTVMPHT